MTKKFFVAIVMVLALTAALFGCGGGGGDNASTPVYNGPVGTVTGKITSNGVTPIGGIIVADNAGTYTTTSNSNGIYTLSLPTGSQTLVFMGSGYINGLGSVTVTTGTTTTYNKTLMATTGTATLSSITVTPNNPSIIVGGTQQLVATGVYSDASTNNVTSSVIWSSSSTSIATVSSSGNVVGVSAGTATITAKYNNTVMGTTIISVVAVPTGKMDTSFGNQGIATYDATSNFKENIHSVKVVQTNKTIGIGIIGVGTYIIAQLTDTGTLDTAFGSGGYVTPTTSGLSLTNAYSMDVLPDGKIAVAGTNNSNLSIIRLNSDGSPDTSFGVNGMASSSITGFSVYKLIYDSVNQLYYVMGGATILRLTATGAVDTTYGTNGTVSLSYLSVSSVNSGILQSDGKLIIVGQGSSYKIGVARYTVAGVLDTSFGNGGVALVNPSTIQNSNPSTSDVAISSSGKLFVSGAAKISGSYSSAVVVSLNFDGTLDTSFGVAGISTFTFSSGVNNVARSIALQADGKIIVGGDSGGSWYGGIARLKTDGTLDSTAFGTNGIISTSPSGIYAVAIRSDEKIIGGGNYNLLIETQLRFIRITP